MIRPPTSPSMTSRSITAHRSRCRHSSRACGSGRAGRSSIGRMPGRRAIRFVSSSTGSEISSDLSEREDRVPMTAEEDTRMTTTATSDNRILALNEFFAASEARVDRWRTLNRGGRALAGTGQRPAAGARPEPKDLLAELAPLEELCGYPGPRLMALVNERLQTGDWTGFARLVQRISGALLFNSYRDDQEAWEAEEG